ncbi:GTPase HflX [Thermanaerosceptrum fracticalcis]|uniref:GTPase HflX n=2 Tax=Thermanaerosceptrum fracticalcis TaxID=1712410 RepID=A0A7G6E889_THEFR|nr:GTPase HflX [Thermanaerosceptrum fracticalcis]
MLQLEKLAETTFPKDLLVSPELAEQLAFLTFKINREIGVYLDRHGYVLHVMIGDDKTTPLIKENLRRGEDRLSGLRCIHTHPSGDSTLSEPDLTSLREFRLDAMVAIGISEDKVTSINVAFLEPNLESFKVYGPFSLEQIDKFPFTEILQEIDKAISKPPAYLVKQEQERVLLVGLKKQDTGLLSPEESLVELEELAKTAGAEITGKILLSRDKPDPALYIGTGKVKELALLRQQHKLDVIIFDDELSPRQQNNLEESLGSRVIDRTALILQIFADRAKTKEGKLQVELAQLNYMLPRLTGQGTSLSRLGGGIGTRGPGETKLETDRRRIRLRIRDLQKEIEEIKKQRGILRQQREHTQIPVVALVGYTNAGKSTLLNALTQANVLAENKLFATLDPTTRRLQLKQREVLLTDTVGFINKLPHQLVAAFRATLEEVVHADLLLHVVDASHPSYEGQITAVNRVLEELKVLTKPTILVLNKWDLVKDPLEVLPVAGKYEAVIPISALKGTNLPELLELINAHLPNKPLQVRLLIPFNQTALLNTLYHEGEVIQTEYVAEGILCDAYLSQPWLNKLQHYIWQKE